jgi:hypothetical protein
LSVRLNASIILCSHFSKSLILMYSNKLIDLLRKKCDKLPTSLSLRLITSIAFFIIFILSCCSLAPASALIVHTEDAPGQTLYQSRQTLEDKTGNIWQVVFFKLPKQDQPDIINLRLVSYASTISFAHPQNLTIALRSGEIYLATDIFAETTPLASVGQYDFKEIIDRLPDNSFCELKLPLRENSKVVLRIPSAVIDEWKAIAAT